MSANGVSWATAYEGMTCSNSTHVLGCAGNAGGDHELRPEYVSYPMCLWCAENPGTIPLDVMADGEPEPFAGICSDCWEEVP